VANAASHSSHEPKIDDRSQVYLAGTSLRDGTTAVAVAADDVIPA
jgi:hypothetical protein